MNMRKPGWIAALAVLALGLAVYAFWPTGPVDAPDIPPDAAAGPAGDAGPVVQSEAAGPVGEPDDEPLQLARRAQQLGAVRQSELRNLAVNQKPFPHDVPLEDYKASLWTEIRTHPPKLVARGDPELDAETAYTMYMYYGMCTMAPNTLNQVDRRLERMAERAGSGSASRRYLKGVEYRADQMIGMYELCSAIPPDVDRRLEAVLWMSEAVRLGHEIAQVQFYEKAMGFLLRPDQFTGGAPLAMQQEGLIGSFKATARLALKRALEKGHPEAYLAMSQAVFDGVVFSRDPVLAYAYARAAELEAMANGIILRNLADQKFNVSQDLDPDQIAEAEELAQRLRAP
jgi:hypothetical protein